MSFTRCEAEIWLSWVPIMMPQHSGKYKATSKKNDDFNVNDNINENKFNDLQNMLDRVNLDEVSPKDALDILYAMKKNF